MTAKNHVPTVFNNTKDGQIKIVCACGDSSFWQDDRQTCDDWWLRHEANVQRVRAHLRKATPSMEDQADYYHAMCELASGKDREAWKQMAHELDVRLGRVGPQWEDLEIPFG